MICTHCGHNSEAERPVTAGAFSYEPARGFAIDGERLPVETGGHLMIGAVMAASGKVVRIDALANRQNEDAARPNKLVDYYVFRLRRAFAARDVKPPFERIHGVGLRWIGPPVDRASV